MTVRDIKKTAVPKLRAASGSEAAIDAEILLAHALGISREELLTHDERRVPSFALRRFASLIARRAKHVPVAYLVGHKEFYGLTFEVNKHTLIPRPETELLVEIAVQQLTTKFQKLVIDIGTGSGAIAVAIAKNAPNAAVIATDVSGQALKVAARNAAENGVEDRIVFRRANLLAALRGQTPFIDDKGSVPFCVVANLPYLPTSIWRKCAPEVKKYEPRTALDGGSDGLRVYDQLFHQLISLNIKPTVICEIDPSQRTSFQKLVKKHFPGAKVTIKNDLAGRPRVAIVNF